MQQRRLFAKETHGLDAEALTWLEREERRGPITVSLRAWCGKTTAPGRIARNGAEPTCYQCHLIWQKLQTSKPVSAT